ncbi:hypothetical protein ACLQ2Q_05350 [Microbacterium sp. DT81.1]
MEMRGRILRETRRLTIEGGSIPSLNAVAEAAEVSTALLSAPRTRP